MLRAQIPRLKWPVQASVFVAHFLHHTLAFFFWASLILHVAIPAVGAGLNVGLIAKEGRSFRDLLSGDGKVSWGVVIAVALVPAVLVALRQAYLSWEGLRERLEEQGVASRLWLKWPVRSCRFVATLLQHTAGFAGWVWIGLALVGSLGAAGSNVSKLKKVSLEYLLDVGGADWKYLITIAAVPGLLIALWNAKRAYRRLHAMAHERLPTRAAPPQPTA